eukprot:1204738-Pyramimonas_sp.AAC.1
MYKPCEKLRGTHELPIHGRHSVRSLFQGLGRCSGSETTVPSGHAPDSRSGPASRSTGGAFRRAQCRGPPPCRRGTPT